MVHSFLLIGQSNMAGRGFVNEVEPIENDRIKVLRNGRWYPMYVPVNCDRPFSGVNLAESFADAYTKDHDAQVGLIPCADGGTSLDHWTVGGLLYDHAVCMAKLAQRTSTIAGVLWHQGEADCSAERYPYYAEKFQVILDALRADLNLYDVPFLVGGLGEYLPLRSEHYKNHIYVNEALQKIARANPMTGFVCAKGLKPNPDNLHFSAKALREFGLRYYEVFQKLENKDKVFEEKNDTYSAARTKMEML